MDRLAESCPDWVAEANAQLCRCRWRPGAAVALRVLAGSLEQVGEARQFVRAILLGNPLRDDVTAVVSELVANAVRHTASGEPGGSVLLSVRLMGALVRVSVTDDGGIADPAMPLAGQEPTEGGMGLLLVGAISAESGWCGDATGRTVWAVLGPS